MSEKDLVNPGNKEKTDTPKVWTKGGPSPNPSGRPRKDDKVEEYLNTMSGDCGQDFFNFLTEIVYYDQQQEDLDYRKRDKIPKYNANHKLKALELLLAYQLGRPRQKIDAVVEQKTLNVNINLPTNLAEEDF
jgi:hypothetical protein